MPPPSRNTPVADCHRRRFSSSSSPPSAMAHAFRQVAPLLLERPNNFPARKPSLSQSFFCGTTSDSELIARLVLLSQRTMMSRNLSAAVWREFSRLRPLRPKCRASGVSKRFTNFLPDAQGVPSDRHNACKITAQRFHAGVFKPRLSIAFQNCMYL